MFQHLAPQTLFSLNGRVVFMTGGAGGIASGLARGFAAAGARLVLVDRDPAVEARAAELRDAGAEASARVLDVTDDAAVRDAVAQTHESAGGPDVVANNAAVIVRRPFLDPSSEEWERVIDVDLTACFSVAQHASRLLDGHPVSDSLASTSAKLAAPITPVCTRARTTSEPRSPNSKAGTAEASSTTGPPEAKLLTPGLGAALGQQLVGDAARVRGIVPHQGLDAAHGVVHAFQHEATFFFADDQ